MRNKNAGSSALLLVLVAWVCGCASQNTKPPTAEQIVQVRYSKMDDFDVLLLRAAVDLTEFPARDAWTADEVGNLVQLLRFKISDGNHTAYGPRILATFVLEEALKTNKPITRAALIQSMHQYGGLAVLNPDGHLVRSDTGTTLLCIGPIHIQDGIPRAGDFKVDAFYVRAADGFHEDTLLVAPAIFTPPASKQPVPQQVADTQPK